MHYTTGRRSALKGARRDARATKIFDDHDDHDDHDAVPREPSSAERVVIVMVVGPGSRPIALDGPCYSNRGT
jgi:hypothetical protein